MDVKTMTEAVKIIAGKCETEAWEEFLENN